MKRLGINILVLLLVSIIGCETNDMNARKSIEKLPDCVASYEVNGEYDLIIIANKNRIKDKEIFAKQIIEMIRSNDFRSVMFSYDMNGYPVGVEMEVYLTENDWQQRDEEPYMRISFRQDDIMNEYNIVEDYDKFQLEIY